MVSEARFRVLVVDADDEQAQELARLLSPEFEVLRARSAESALSELETASVHVVCSDYEMPGMDGVSFLRRVAALPDAPCFLLVTSASEMKDKQLEGLSGVISRPYDPKALRDRVSRLCWIADTRRRVASARTAIENRQREPDPGR